MCETGHDLARQIHALSAEKRGLTIQNSSPGPAKATQFVCAKDVVPQPLPVYDSRSKCPIASTAKVEAGMVSRYNIVCGLTLTLNIILTPLPAAADSDGYFCTTDNYLAFELRSFNTPAINGKHVLKIVRFGSAQGIFWGGEVSFEDFQVHEMQCEPERVRVAGWDRGYVGYVVDISDPKQLRIVEHLQDSDRKFNANEQGPEPQNLGNWARPGTIQLKSSDPHHTYQLVFTDSQEPRRCTIDHHQKTELQQLDIHGNVTQRLVVFEGTSTETGCD
jgi:hypothetical protein